MCFLVFFFVMSINILKLKKKKKKKEKIREGMLSALGENISAQAFQGFSSLQTGPAWRYDFSSQARTRIG